MQETWTGQHSPRDISAFLVSGALFISTRRTVRHYCKELRQPYSQEEKLSYSRAFFRRTRIRRDYSGLRASNQWSEKMTLTKHYSMSKVSKFSNRKSMSHGKIEKTRVRHMYATFLHLIETNEL